jgi:hypothetical protein
VEAAQYPIRLAANQQRNAVHQKIDKMEEQLRACDLLRFLSAAWYRLKQRNIRAACSASGAPS